MNRKCILVIIVVSMTLSMSESVDRTFNSPKETHSHEVQRPNVDRDRRAMDQLEICYRKLRPDALIINHRSGKWVSQLWQKDRLFGTLTRDSMLLDLPTVPLYDFLDPNQVKSYIIYKAPGNWGPLTILIKPHHNDRQFATLLVAIILNDTIDLSDAVTLSNYGEQVYSYTTFCAPPGQYRIILRASHEQEPIHVELVHRYEQMYQEWTHFSQIVPSKVRCRRRKQNKQMLIKWDKCNVDGNQMQYCLVVNNQRNYPSFCEAISNKFTNESLSCQGFDFLHGGFSSNKLENKINSTRRLELNGSSIFCTGTKSQQLFRRFKPNMNYFIDVFGVHPKLGQLTFHLGSLRLYHSNKNLTIPLVDGRTGHGKLSQSNDLITFSYKPIIRDAKEITLYIVPCGGTILVRILKQKRLLVELRHIHKPIMYKLNMTRFHGPAEGRLVIKVLPNSVDETMRNIKVEVTSSSLNPLLQLPSLPRNLTLTYVSSYNSCKSVELLWTPVPASKSVRYCILLMITSAYEDLGYCSIDQKLLKHPRFQQLHCFYSRFGSSLKMERMTLTDLTPRVSYTAYLFASLRGNPKDLIKYEPLRIHNERWCHFYDQEITNGTVNEYYDSNQIN